MYDWDPGLQYLDAQYLKFKVGFLGVLGKI